MTKTCKVCGVTSDVAEFYAGVNIRCKDCHKKLVKENREDKAEYYKQYDAFRYQNDPKVKERHRRYAQTDQGRFAFNKARLKWLEKSPEKRACHVILNNAIKNGKVLKPKVCQICSAGGRIEGHHHDYTKPLDVQWVCRKCHVEIHRKERNNE